jgi:hypothetical protein
MELLIGRHNQGDHIFVDKIWRAHKINVQNFRKAACDSSHYLLTAKVRSGLSVNK